MISDESALEEITRMSQLAGYPREKAALMELVKALQSAESIDHAKSTITEFLDDWNRTKCPLPAEIKKALYSSRPEGPAPPRAPLSRNGYSCGYVCDGWGTVGERPNVKWCTCDHAEWLKREIPNWLTLANQMPAGFSSLRPRSFSTQLIDTLASGSVAGESPRKKPPREPGDETENGEQNNA